MIEKKSGIGKITVFRGAEDEERLYLYDKKFKCNEEYVSVKKTSLPDMDNLIMRHKGRYMLPSMFLRFQNEILDFPCGGGIGYEAFPDGGFYEGRDNDPPTIEYCKRIYSKHSFLVDDMRDPHLPSDHYNIIACIEGIEHIEKEYQGPLIKAFYEALKSNGTLVVTSPEAPNEMSGASKINPYHLWELSRLSFTNILGEVFEDVQILFYKDILHNGQEAVMMFGVCRK